MFGYLTCISFQNYITKRGIDNEIVAEPINAAQMQLNI